MKIKHFSWPVLLLFFAHCATALADPPPTKFVPVPHKYVKTGLTVSFQTALVHNTGRTFIRMDASQTPGAAFDHGIYSWKPTLADIGTKRVTFTATRDGATIDTMEVPITVEPNRKRKGPLPGHKKTEGDEGDKPESMKANWTETITQKTCTVGLYCHFFMKAKKTDGTRAEVVGASIPTWAHFNDAETEQERNAHIDEFYGTPAAGDRTVNGPEHASFGVSGALVTPESIEVLIQVN